MAKHIWISDNDTFKWEHGGEKYCLHIGQDTTEGNPREEMNHCLMACFHSRYNLGDSFDQKEPEEFWQKMVTDLVPGDALVQAARNGEIEGMKVVVDEEDPRCVDLCLRWEGAEDHWSHNTTDELWLEDDIRENLTVGNCQKLLEPHCEWMPLWLYDHGGLSISCGTRNGQYADPWDSGCVGWIVAMKDKIMQETVEILRDENGKPIFVEYKHEGAPSTFGVMSRPLTDATWRNRAIEIMQGEVETYDQWLRGEVYGYDLYKQEDGEWSEQDSCWGFYGDDLLENGIPDQVGCGLMDALENEDYEQGEAVEEHTVSYYFG